MKTWLLTLRATRRELAHVRRELVLTQELCAAAVADAADAQRRLEQARLDVSSARAEMGRVRHRLVDHSDCVPRSEVIRLAHQAEQAEARAEDAEFQLGKSQGRRR